MESDCPNFEVCDLVTIKGFGGNEKKRLHYLESYCTSKQLNWKHCSRLITKNTLNFCPDFVLPDSDMTPDEVIEKFDKELE